jgi:hypothetical protein
MSDIENIRAILFTMLLEGRASPNEARAIVNSAEAAVRHEREQCASLMEENGPLRDKTYYSDMIRRKGWPNP